MVVKGMVKTGVGQDQKNFLDVSRKAHAALTEGFKRGLEETKISLLV